MRYEWDERKNRQNQRKHGGISFELAALVFEDPNCLIELDRVDEAGEQRWHALGTASVRPGIGALTSMTSEDIKSRKWTKSEIEAVRKANEAQAAGRELPEKEYEDIPRLTEEQLASMVRLRDVRRKVPVSVRLDPRVLDWLRSKGEGHLTRINDILINLMEAERRIGTGR
jgi:uncharacterized DUF497 family protein